MAFLQVVVAVCAVLGGAVALLGVLGSQGAPQEAAAAAVGMAIAVIPYVFMRALQASQHTPTALIGVVRQGMQLAREDARREDAER